MLNTIVPKAESTTSSETLADSQNSQLQSQDNGGIINQGGENNELSNQGTVNEGIQERMDTGRKSQMGKSNETVDGYVQRGKAEILSGSTGEVQRRIRINHTKNSSVSFTEGKADNTNGYKAYVAFANAGVQVIYCDGPIERTVNGVTVSSTEAFTAPDGTVYISSQSSLPAKQTFDHEKVHVAQKSNNPVYIEYESSLCENARYYSSTYLGLAEDINKYQFNSKYDIEDISSASIFMREIAAYINQFVLSDPAFAEQTFGGMFENWGAVIEAVNKFNTDMKADFTESANFMSQNENTALESGEYGLTEPSDQEIYRDPTEEENRGKRKNAKQRHILDVAKKLDSGMKVVFVSENAEVLSGQKGVYMRDSNTVYLSESNSAVESYYQIFKHEFIHRLESKGAYQSFKNYLFRNSSAFERYARAQLGKDFKGTREEALQDLAQHYIGIVQKGKFSQKYKQSFTLEDAQREMVADFISEVLFKGNRKDVAQHLADSDMNAILDIEDTLTEFESLTETDRKWFQKIIDTIKDFIASLKGVNQNKRLVEDLEYIEKRLGRVLDSKDTKKAAKNSGRVQYHLSEDTRLHEYIEDALAGNLPKKSFYKVNETISDRLATDIEKIVGFSVKGYSNEIAPGNIQHIENEHGANGRKDQSMKSHHDLARVSFVVDNYEKIKEGKISGEYKNSDGTKAKTIELQKKIDDEFYYVVEAVPDASLKTLHIVSAYKNQKDTFSDVPVSNDPRRYVQDEHQPNVSNDIILKDEQSVNSNSMQEVQDYSESTPKGKRSFSLGSPAQQMRDNLKRYERGEITREEYLEKTDELWGEANETHGMLPQGENAKVKTVCIL